MVASTCRPKYLRYKLARVISYLKINRREGWNKHVLGGNLLKNHLAGRCLLRTQEYNKFTWRKILFAWILHIQQYEITECQRPKVNLPPLIGGEIEVYMYGEDG